MPLLGSSPRTSPSVLPVLPRIPGPRLQPPPSLEGGEEELSSWGVLVGVRGLLSSPHSQHCRAGHRESEQVPGECIHSFIHSFKAMRWGPPHAWSRSKWCWGHSGETTSSPVPMGLQSNGVQTRHQTVAARSGQGWDEGSSGTYGSPEETPLQLRGRVKVGFPEKEPCEPRWGGGRLRQSTGEGVTGGGNGWEKGLQVREEHSFLYCLSQRPSSGPGPGMGDAEVPE